MIDAITDRFQERYGLVVAAAVRFARDRSCVDETYQVTLSKQTIVPTVSPEEEAALAETGRDMNIVFFPRSHPVRRAFGSGA